MGQMSLRAYAGQGAQVTDRGCVDAVHRGAVSVAAAVFRLVLYDWERCAIVPVGARLYCINSWCTGPSVQHAGHIATARCSMVVGELGRCARVQGKGLRTSIPTRGLMLIAWFPCPATLLRLGLRYCCIGIVISVCLAV